MSPMATLRDRTRASRQVPALCWSAWPWASKVMGCGEDPPPPPGPGALSTGADPGSVPEYSPLVARWEWPPWLYLTGYKKDLMIASTKVALQADPSEV